jgi:hypothetical protein
MPLIKFTDDKIIKRLRWVMIGTMLFSMINTLAGQSRIFWYLPGTAIRGDGLSINNETNHTFEFFLGSGWQAYLIANLIYFSGTFLLVSVLPKRVALITIFSFIFGHFFVGSNWLAVRWHLGIQGSMLYAFVLVPAIVLSAFPATGTKTNQIINGLRWVVIGTILLDVTCTLIGQPTGYWNHPGLVHEANPVSLFLLLHGWYTYLLVMGLVYCSVIFWLVSVLQWTWALICSFFIILVSFIGASNWFFYEWRMGMESPVIIGIVFSLAIAWVAFPTTIQKNNHFTSIIV